MAISLAAAFRLVRTEALTRTGNVNDTMRVVMNESGIAYTNINDMLAAVAAAGGLTTSRYLLDYSGNYVVDYSGNKITAIL